MPSGGDDVIKIGDLVMDDPDCKKVAPIPVGILQCVNVAQPSGPPLRQRLEPFHGFGLFKSTPMIGSDAKRKVYIENFRDQNITVCDKGNFARKSGLIRIKIAKPLCPWYSHSAIKYRTVVRYGERFGLIGGLCEIEDHSRTWPKDSPLELTLTAGPIPEEFRSPEGAPGIGESGGVHIRATVNSDQERTHVVFLDLEYTVIPGGDVSMFSGFCDHQTTFIGCDAWAISGATFGSFCTWLSRFDGPLATVHSIYWEVSAGFGWIYDANDPRLPTDPPGNHPAHGCPHTACYDSFDTATPLMWINCTY